MCHIPQKMLFDNPSKWVDWTKIEDLKVFIENSVLDD